MEFAANIGKIYNIAMCFFLHSSMGAGSLTQLKYKVTWKTFLVPVIGLVAFFLYIYLFNVDIQQIIAKLQQINLGYYLFAMVAALLDIAFFSMAWHSLLSRLSVKISLFKSFLFVWIGIFVDTMIPAESVSGEISKIYLVNREQMGTAGKATASVVAQRLIGMSINVGTLVTGAVLLLIQHLLYGMILTLILFLVAVTFVFLALILFLCGREKWTMGIVDKIISFAEWISRGRWKLGKLREEVIEATKAFHTAIKEYAHAPKTLVIASCFSVISWLFALGIFYLTFLSIGYTKISWSAILVVSAIFVAVKSVPVGVPFEIGLPEITLTTLFYLFTGDAQVSATATILSRLLTLWLRFFIGFGAQQWIGIKAITASTNNKTAVNAE
jgi:uncharacterized protein (TIRG00374 family)